MIKSLDHPFNQSMNRYLVISKSDPRSQNWRFLESYCYIISNGYFDSDSSISWNTLSSHHALLLRILSADSYNPTEPGTDTTPEIIYVHHSDLREVIPKT